MLAESGQMFKCKGIDFSVFLTGRTSMEEIGGQHWTCPSGGAIRAWQCGDVWPAGLAFGPGGGSRMDSWMHARTHTPRKECYIGELSLKSGWSSVLLLDMSILLWSGSIRPSQRSVPWLDYSLFHEQSWSNSFRAVQLEKTLHQPCPESVAWQSGLHGRFGKHLARQSTFRLLCTQPEYSGPSESPLTTHWASSARLRYWSRVASVVEVMSLACLQNPSTPHLLKTRKFGNPFKSQIGYFRAKQGFVNSTIILHLLGP